MKRLSIIIIIILFVVFVGIFIILRNKNVFQKQNIEDSALSGLEGKDSLELTTAPKDSSAEVASELNSMATVQNKDSSQQIDPSYSNNITAPK